MTQNNISFAGAGRVAFALCREIHSTGIKIDLVVSPTREKGSILADMCGAEWSSGYVFPSTTGLIIVAVPDHRLPGVLDSIRPDRNVLVVHTAGSMGMDVFPGHIKRRGIFYPLQTFSANREVSFKDLPFLVEASDNDSFLVLKELAENIGGRVHYADSQHRRWLHLAAVFACNFTNYMLTIGQDIAGKAGFDADILEPLIKETLAKALENGPENSQTGPAVRNDINTIEKHLELLSFSPDLEKIYSDITVSIINYYKIKQ